MTNKKDKDSETNWSGAAKVGAAVGSAALVAALLYAGRRNLTRKKGKLEPQSPSLDKTTTDTLPATKPVVKPRKVPASAKPSSKNKES